MNGLPEYLIKLFPLAVKFLSALAADGTIPDVEAIISSNLSAAFDSLKENMADSISTQEKLLAAVQVGKKKGSLHLLKKNAATSNKKGTKHFSVVTTKTP